MTQTYSEARRSIVFKAARDLRKLAASVLEDVTEQDVVTLPTFTWAKATAANIARQANALETEGYEIGTYLDTRTEGVQRKSRQAYTKAVNAFQNRAAVEGCLAQVNAYQADPAPKIGA